MSNKGPTVDNGECRCCGSKKRCRIINEEYDYWGQKEVYSNMFVDCFGLLLSHLDGAVEERLICATCVNRLREACNFKREVLVCEEKLLRANIQDVRNDEWSDKEIKEENCTEDTTVDVGNDKLEEFDDDMDDRDDVFNNQEDEVAVEVKTECKAEDNPLNVKCVSPVDELNGSSNMDDGAQDALLQNIRQTREKLLMLKKTAEEKPNAPNRTVRRATRSKRKDVNASKENLLRNIQQTREKIKSMMHKTKPKKKSQPTDEERQAQHNYMLYRNTVNIVKTSYVCPFRNRTSIYYCYYCRDQYTNPTELREHTLTHQTKLFARMMENRKIPKIDITRIDCRLCTETIDNIPDFKKHATTKHNVFLYPVENEFIKFKLTLTNLSCTECTEVFPYFDQLSKHMTTHFGTYVCHKCGSCFVDPTSFRAHIRRHDRVEMNFPCEICGKNLKSKHSRALHITTVHEKIPTVRCYKCDSRFMSHAVRNRHMIEKHGDTRTFPCKLCGKVYNRRKTYVEHHRRTHLNVLKHQCDLCDQRFYIPSELKDHRASHFGDREFKCDLCDKSYGKYKMLREHIRKHNDGKRFKCESCTASFTQRVGLNNHMKNHHQNFDGFTQ